MIDEASEEIDRLLTPYAPPSMRDPRLPTEDNPFGSDKAMEAMLGDAGASDVRTVLATQTLEFADVEAWHRFAMSTALRMMLVNVPPEELPRLLERAQAILDDTRDGDGPARLEWQVRYTLGRSAAH